MFHVYLVPVHASLGVIPVFRFQAASQEFLDVLFPMVSECIVFVTFGGVIPDFDAFFGDRAYSFVTLGVGHAAR